MVEERIIEIFGAKVSVYSDGSVWIHRGSRNKRRFGHTTDKGYKAVLIRDNGVERTVFVHRIVAKAFVPNPDNKPQVNHKDGNKSNNRPEKLEWCTLQENMKHKSEVLKSFSAKCPVMCVETGEVFETTSEAAKVKHTYRTSIWRSVQHEGMRYTAAGLHWRRVGVN